MQSGRFLLLSLSISMLAPSLSNAWDDKTHIAIAKVAGYEHWYNATGADMAKIKAGDIEEHNHYVNNPPETVVTPEMVLTQAASYNNVDEEGHLYGAIIASLRDHEREKQNSKTRAYHLSFCVHYVGDLSQPLHNTLYNDFNKRFHQSFDAVIDDEVLSNLHKIRPYPIRIGSERALAAEIARIATLSMRLGYKLEAEGRTISKEEAYVQVGHSASLLKAILEYVEHHD